MKVDLDVHPRSDLRNWLRQFWLLWACDICPGSGNIDLGISVGSATLDPVNTRPH